MVLGHALNVEWIFFQLLECRQTREDDPHDEVVVSELHITWVEKLW
jgi:hypothetical protein